MLWELGNAVVKPDNNGNVKPMKKNKSSPDKIDNVITSIMALDRCRSGLSSNVKRKADSFDAIMKLISH
jgi:phage terminase large subunit-like protein